jgi:D-glycero-D-manno-heptose 1,7-bisphosphate phosphatase
MGIERGQRAVFLDRDGVINRAVVRDGRPYPPASLAELEVLPGVGDAIDRLRAAGFAIVVVTNQPDVARGTQTREAVDALHARLAADLGLDDFRVCAHDDGDGCACRKPLPGLLREAAAAHGLDLTRSFMVGDRWRDVDAGRAAGCRTVFVDRHYTERRPDRQDATVASLAAAADWILSHDTNEDA